MRAELIVELRQIMKEEFGFDLSDEDSELTAEALLKLFNELIDIHSSNA